MELSRRHAIVGAAVALAGCSGVQAGIEERADGILPNGEHPLSGTTSIAVVDRSETEHDLEQLAAEAAAYWTENDARYVGFDVSFVMEDESPDIELVFLDSGVDLEGCREHSSSEILGCAPLLTAEHRPERPIRVEVVAADRPYGEIRITAKHELGHVLGLGHDDEPAYIMSNEIEHRLPEYGRRTEILDAFENGWNGRNAGTREYNRAVDRWNDEEYENAVEIFETSAGRYRTAVASIETAAELERGFDGMVRPDTVDRPALRDGFRRAREWIRLAAERSDLMAASSAARIRGDGETARKRRTEADEVFAELQTIEFPAPIDVATALGLLERGSHSDR